MSTRVRVLGVFLVALAMISGACTSSSSESTTTASTTRPTETSTTTSGTATTTTTTIPATTTTTAPQSGATVWGLRATSPFAAGFPVNPLIVDEPAYRGPGTPTTLDDILWLDEVSWIIEAHPEVPDLLAENGFVIVADGMTQFHQAYGAVDAYRRQPLFITTDAAYHYWHLVFAKALKDTEQLVLLPTLETFAVRLLAVAEAQRDLLAGTDLATAADAVVGYAQVVGAIAETLPGPHDDRVVAELALVRDHAEWTTSPASGADVDYTLFAPRGHYTENRDLTRYFLAMSALGATAFRIADDDHLRTAVLLSRAITTDGELADSWRDLYEPTAFLVGLADDYSPFEVAEAVAAAGVDADAIESLDAATIESVRAELVAMRAVAIDEERASVRVMGARFVLDSFIIDQLVDPNVSNRVTSSALDVAAAFGSDWAYDQQAANGVPASFPEYDGQMQDMRDLVTGRSADEWAGTVYDAWLYAIQPSWTRHGAAYPDFMQTGEWAAKAHQTGFGSYTELKHDTVLYSKQGYAEGEGPPPPPAEPRHWVEPEPVTYARLAAVASLMHAGLSARDLLADDVGALLDLLIPMYERFERLARDELAGRSISQDDNRWLEGIGATFELLWLLANEDSTADAGVGGFSEAPYDMAGLVVDIMSNPESALELGTGLVDLIYVLVPNDEGRFQLARGGVYSFYEFWVPRSERMTDDEWRMLFVNEWGGMAQDTARPDRPDWMLPILAAPIE